MDSMPRLGAIVDGPDGAGVVTDRAFGHREALVRLHKGSVLDTTHGRWAAVDGLTVTGFDADADVWYAARIMRASDVPTV